MRTDGKRIFYTAASNLECIKSCKHDSFPPDFKDIRNKNSFFTSSDISKLNLAETSSSARHNMPQIHLLISIAAVLAALMHVGELKKVYDCVYDPNKCSHFCGVEAWKMPQGFGCLNTLKACLCPTTPNTKMCRPINPADPDEGNGCNSSFNCPSSRLVPMICEFFDQNKMCACFRVTPDGHDPSECKDTELLPGTITFVEPAESNSGDQDLSVPEEAVLPEVSDGEADDGGQQTSFGDYPDHGVPPS